MFTPAFLFFVYESRRHLGTVFGTVLGSVLGMALGTVPGAVAYSRPAQWLDCGESYLRQVATTKLRRFFVENVTSPCVSVSERVWIPARQGLARLSEGDSEMVSSTCLGSIYESLCFSLIFVFLSPPRAVCLSACLSS